MFDSWNHRVIRTEDAGGPYYAIHECHYEKRGDTIPHSWTVDPVHVGSETRRGLFWVLSVMTEAVGKPILKIVGNTLEEAEPVQELSDNLRAVLEHGKLIGRGEDEQSDAVG